MTKEEYLGIAASRYEETESLKAKDNFYDCEKSFDQIWQDLGCRYLENHLNEQSSIRDRRKKTLAGFEETVINKSHPYMQGLVNEFAISLLMQVLITYAGHLECYAKSEEIQEKFTQVKVSPSQVYRVTDSAGACLGRRGKVGRAYPASVIERGSSLSRDRRYHVLYAGGRAMERSQAGQTLQWE